MALLTEDVPGLDQNQERYQVQDRACEADDQAQFAGEGFRDEVAQQEKQVEQQIAVESGVDYFAVEYAFRGVEGGDDEHNAQQREDYFSGFGNENWRPQQIHGVGESTETGTGEEQGVF